ncbi:hypothetical protein BDV38DRAFT_290946 [Aspergillus pseudotamarii]|uniref:Uncharacterized protein n=1 Tax=Aspergillus pseudotamarii TaxID=132259 RepID=A0A5N6SB79_ASPPS|nr:uncharacterized protein BDV38DRAFT_290946 [Aspergillus pseudotamarii]KAE8130921.1 hypothetical protein BDV38DRAFT_290946 [Aspergillus pseudotamarii]
MLTKYTKDFLPYLRPDASRFRIATKQQHMQIDTCFRPTGSTDNLGAHLYALCTPHIKHHNRLRWHFESFEYGKTDLVVQHKLSLFTLPYTACSAFDLIARIAVEPTVAHYIGEADFEKDGQFTRGISRTFATDASRDKAVTKLLAESSYLREAGLAWQEYYAAIEDDLDAARYSQHAAAFVLTLLPNIKVLKLPREWKPIAATNKLLEVIMRRSRRALIPHHKPSIAQVTRFEVSASLDAGERFDLDWATCFLTLPHVRSFWGLGCVGTGDGYWAITSAYLPNGFQSLEAVHFMSASIDDKAIAGFLKHTPNLKTLRYSHTTNNNGGLQDWDLCRFVAAIEREAGSHLVELSISIDELRGSITPGKVSMRGFCRLEKLELPLEITICTLHALGEQQANYSDLFLGDLIPSSVSQLSLISHGMDGWEKALSMLFRDFAARKGSQVPALKEIYLSWPIDVDDLDEKQYTTLAVETQKAGVVLDIMSDPLTWDGEE